MNLITELQVRASVRLGPAGVETAKRSFASVCADIEERAIDEYGEETRHQRMRIDHDTAEAHFLSAIADGGTINQAAEVARASIGL